MNKKLTISSILGSFSLLLISIVYSIYFAEPNCIKMNDGSGGTYDVCDNERGILSWVVYAFIMLISWSIGIAFIYVTSKWKEIKNSESTSKQLKL